MTKITKEDEMIAELKNIVTLLIPKPAIFPLKNFIEEFKDFLTNFKVLRKDGSNPKLLSVEESKTLLKSLKTKKNMF